MAKQTKKATVPKAGVTLNQQFPFVRSQDFKTIYANTVKLSFTANEMRMTFVHVTDDVGVNKFVQQEEGMIVMHPFNAKLLMAQIKKGLDSYEAQMGPLVIPDEIKEAFGIE
jgi:hypothetical protein